MTQVDYYNDPNAPRANTVVPAVSVAVRDDDGRLLLVPAADRWRLPAAAVRPGETVADAAIGAVRDQTGVEVEVTGLVGVYSSPAHVVAHEDGEVRQELCLCFEARSRGESAAGPEAGWYEVAELDELPIHLATRTQINDALADRARPRIA